MTDALLLRATGAAAVAATPSLAPGMSLGASDHDRFSQPPCGLATSDDRSEI